MSDTTNSMAPMVLAFGRRFAALHPGVQIEVRSVGTSRGLYDVSHGKNDVGMVSRPLTAEGYAFSEPLPADLFEARFLARALPPVREPPPARAHGL
jgi:ABC-type phosphate transport system substrate-binding protein